MRGEVYELLHEPGGSCGRVCCMWDFSAALENVYALGNLRFVRDHYALEKSSQYMCCFNCSAG